MFIGRKEYVLIKNIYICTYYIEDCLQMFCFDNSTSIGDCLYVIKKK